MNEEVQAIKRVGNRIAGAGALLTAALATAALAPLGCDGSDEDVDLTPTVDTREEVEEAADAIANEVQAHTEVAAETAQREVALNAKVAQARLDELEARARELRLEAKAEGVTDEMGEEFDEARANAKAALAELDEEPAEANHRARQRVAKALDVMSEELSEWEGELEPDRDSREHQRAG